MQRGFAVDSLYRIKPAPFTRNNKKHSTIIAYKYANEYKKHKEEQNKSTFICKRNNACHSLLYFLGIAENSQSG